MIRITSSQKIFLNNIVPIQVPNTEIVGADLIDLREGGISLLLYELFR